MINQKIRKSSLKRKTMNNLFYLLYTITKIIYKKYALTRSLGWRPVL